MSERRLPIYARWTLMAQGSVAWPERARPICPVATWLLQARPELAPFDPDPDRLAAIRIRACLVDDLLLQIRDAAVATGRPLEIWSLGGGFDARWARLAGPMSPAVTRWVEVDEPRVIATKSVALRRSPFAEHYARVASVPMVPAGWGVEPTEGALPVVLLEGLLHRLPAQGLRTLLRRIRQAAPDASVLLDLTGVQGVASAGWSERRMGQLGWQVADDLQLAFRDLLLDRHGEEVVAGSVPVRVQHLIGRPGSTPVIPARR